MPPVTQPGIGSFPDLAKHAKPSSQELASQGPSHFEQGSLTLQPLSLYFRESK